MTLKYRICVGFYQISANSVTDEGKAVTCNENKKVWFRQKSKK